MSALNTMQVGDLEVLSLFDGSVKFPATAPYSMGPAGMKGREDSEWEPHRALLDDGMVELVRQIDLAIHNPIWADVRLPAPWEQPADAKVDPFDGDADHVAHSRKKFAATTADDMGEC